MHCIVCILKIFSSYVIFAKECAINSIKPNNEKHFHNVRASCFLSTGVCMMTTVAKVSRKFLYFFFFLFFLHSLRYVVSDDTMKHLATFRKKKKRTENARQVTKQKLCAYFFRLCLNFVSSKCFSSRTYLLHVFRAAVQSISLLALVICAVLYFICIGKMILMFFYFLK